MLTDQLRGSVDLSAVRLPLEGERESATHLGLCIRAGFVFETVGEETSLGPNDFYSNGDYWWPDPTKTDGLPYIQRDGQTNPENFNQHRLAVRQLRDAVAALGAAYKLTAEDRYAAKAAELLRVFFLDPATRMNPHLNYAQAIPGVSSGRGIGIIDTLHLIEIPPAIEAIQTSAAFPKETHAALKQWFGDGMSPPPRPNIRLIGKGEAIALRPARKSVR